MSHSAVGTNYLNHEKGLWSWLTTLDHKRIGLMYFFTIMVFFLIGGTFALLIRLELMYPGPTLGITADKYNQFMTYHGVTMVFMVIIPAIPAFLGNFFLPMMIGAKDVAFPRLNLLSYYVFITGALLGFTSLFAGGVDTGWTFYTPYSIKTSTAVLPVALAAFIMGMSSILTGLNFIVTVHKLRCPGMSLMRMPLFVWALYGTAILQVLATPVIGITVLLLFAERVLGIGFFDPRLGGDPILFQHFFWFYSHPAVYIMVLPPMGIVSELITTYSRKTLFGYTSIVYSTMAIAAISFFVWGHHMFVSGQSEWAGFIFSIITMLVGVPTAIKTFNWIATMYRGSVRLDAPMLFAIGFLFLFTIGGMTGIMLACLAVDVHMHDTYFVVAHFHYTMVGGSLLAFMGGIYHWFPKMFGRICSDAAARLSWIFIFLGFNVTFFPQFILGAMGMPRRYFDYLPEYASLNLISTVGSWMIATGFIISLFTIIHALVRGEKATANPWESTTLEWQAPSPPPHDNFPVTPTVVGGPYEYR